MGVPLEWNVFMIFGVLSLFVGHAHIGLRDLKHPVPVATLFVVIAGIVLLGNMFPRKISFLPGMRYYAGNWDTTLWCIKASASDKISRGIVAIASMPQAQLERFYGSPEAAQIPIYMGYAFRGFNTHGRALFTLAHRAMAGQNEDDYVITDGETNLQHRHRLELRRRPHAQRAADRRDAGALPLRARRGAGGSA